MNNFYIKYIVKYKGEKGHQASEGYIYDLSNTEELFKTMSENRKNWFWQISTKKQRENYLAFLFFVRERKYGKSKNFLTTGKYWQRIETELCDDKISCKFFDMERLKSP